VLEFLKWPQLQILWFYRRIDWLHRTGRDGAARIVSVFGRFFTGVEIEPGAQIGARLRISHGHGTVIGHGVRIGDDCRILHAVTLGRASYDSTDGYPAIGDRVTIYAGSAVLGNITVGDDAVIGAGVVVTKDVPAGATLFAAPARVLQRALIDDAQSPSAAA
jgi:serine O-acetyltransferase